MNVHFSSEKDDWETPQDLFDLLDSEFHFTLDVCATKENAKCERFYTIDDNGLDKNWQHNVCWMNPPYGKEIGKWIYKAHRSKSFVVCLIPARTDTRWWWDHCAVADQVRFLKGRIRFGGYDSSAPFPSAIVIFKPAFLLSRSAYGTKAQPTKTLWWDWKKELL